MDAASALFDLGSRPPGSAVVEHAYAAYHGELERRLTGLLRDPAAAEDLSQEAFLRLHVEVAAGRAPDNVRAWLHRVAGNLVTSRGRRGQVAARLAPRLVSTDVGTPTDEIALRHADDAVIRAALADLRAAEREVLLLAASGFTGPEIAARLGRTQAATRTILCRARLRLRQEVARLEPTV